MASDTALTSRRRFLSAAAAGAAWLFVSDRAASAQRSALDGGRLIATLPLDRPAAERVPIERLLGSGLDARLFTDLSKLTSDTLVTANEAFFVRTAAPPRLPARDQWALTVSGYVRTPTALRIESLERDVRDRGIHLLECSGNSAPTFALMSAAKWQGVPISSILEQSGPLPGATRVLISGIDDVEARSSTSVPGASWIFAREDLERAGAFLATRMNGLPLPGHHGGPVRLVVPGWYGCACIKWVNEIALMDEDAPATSQMREFAARTHQNGMPARARDYAPATIDTAAMPIRIEKWILNGRPVYRIVGIVWGGPKATNALTIRFKADQAFVPVDDCPLPSSTNTWSLWSHLWRPAEPARYQIVLRVDDPAVRTRRLDLYFYSREVSIDEV